MPVEYGPYTFQDVVFGPFIMNKRYPVSVSLNNTGTANATITYVSASSGQVIGPEVILAGGALVRSLQDLFSFTLDTTNSGAIVTIEILSIESLDYKYG